MTEQLQELAKVNNIEIIVNDEMINKITEKAKEHLNCKNGYIRPSVILKWLCEINEIEVPKSITEEIHEVKVIEKEIIKEVPAKKNKKKNNNIPTKHNQVSLF